MRLLRCVEAVHASRIDPKNPHAFIKDVNSILTCQLWLKIYVVVNRSLEIDYQYDNDKFYQYDKFITYDVLLIFPHLFDKWGDAIVYRLCEDGDVHNLIKIHDRFDLGGKARWFYTVFFMHRSDTPLQIT